MITYSAKCRLLLSHVYTSPSQTRGARRPCLGESGLRLGCALLFPLPGRASLSLSFSSAKCLYKATQQLMALVTPREGDWAAGLRWDQGLVPLRLVTLQLCEGTVWHNKFINMH